MEMTSTSPWPELAILDVGHGSSTLICDDEHVIVIDAPQGSSILLEALEWRDVTEVKAVLISHSDSDHAGGLLTLLTDPDITVREVYFNPDALKNTDVWATLQVAVRDARRDSKVVFHTQLTTTVNGQLDTERLKVEVLAPTPEVAMTGVGGTTPSGRALKSNSMSAVIRISSDTCRGVLLMGDLDDVGLEELLSEDDPPGADVLLFPHHGGLPGGQDPERFARRVSAAVRADTVVFSLSRNQKGTPRPAILSGLRKELPQAHVACTQLSMQCAATLPMHDEQNHLGEWPARGRHTGTCCAGTISFTFTDDGLVRDRHDHHVDYVSGLEARLCRMKPDGSDTTQLTP